MNGPKRQPGLEKGEESSNSEVDLNQLFQEEPEGNSCRVQTDTLVNFFIIGTLEEGQPAKGQCVQTNEPENLDPQGSQGKEGQTSESEDKTGTTSEEEYQLTNRSRMRVPRRKAGKDEEFQGRLKNPKEFFRQG